jgi:pimeloyl-ACP methyl ester carboxylesterase
MQKIKPFMLIALLLSGIVITLFSVNIQTNADTSGSNLDFNWALIANGTAVKGYPNLAETIWQKNASMAPNGPYDKIGLHRLVKAGVTPKAVVFINPGTYMSGEQLISNSPTDSYTLNENSSEAIYWANQGFDVYAIDYRTHFVPNTLNISQLSFMQNWGWDQWISDIREAVLKTKDISGATKIFMAGMSFGGGATMNYASIYGNQDLRGIILLDGGNATKNPTPTNTYNLTSALNQMNSTGTWALETPNLPGLPSAAPSGFVFLMKYASQNPSAPAQYPPGTALAPPVNPATQLPWANITQWAGFVLNGASTNIAGGFGNSSIDTLVTGRMDRYWPLRLNIESAAINDWTNNTAVTYDFDDNYGKINVPLLGFTSELFGLSRFGPIGNSIANSDMTKIVLASYGHLDVFFGTYSAKDVSQPTLDWMTSHTPAPLVVYVTLPPPSITTGQTTTLMASPSGGVTPYTLQWYENGNTLTGQTTNQIAITKSAAGTFTYFCQITDSEGKTANSAVTTLIVNPQATQTPIPTAKPTTTPTQEPTPTPTATPTTIPTVQPSTTSEPATFGSSEIAYAATAGLIIAIIVIAAAVVTLRKRKK